MEIYHIYQADKVALNADNATSTKEFAQLQEQANSMCIAYYSVITT